jgi:hypothetical protein
MFQSLPGKLPVPIVRAILLLQPFVKKRRGKKRQISIKLYRQNLTPATMKMPISE